MLERPSPKRNSLPCRTATRLGTSVVVAAVLALGLPQAGSALGISVGIGGVKAGVSVGAGSGGVTAGASVGVGSGSGAGGNVASASVGIGGGTGGIGASVGIGGSPSGVAPGDDVAGGAPGTPGSPKGIKTPVNRAVASAAARKVGQCAGRGADRGNLTAYGNYQLLDRKGGLLGWVADMTVSDRMKIEKIRFMGVDNACYIVSGAAVDIANGSVRMN